VGLSIDLETEHLAAKVAAMANETKAEAIRRALEERCARLQANEARKAKRKNLQEWLEREVWPTIPPELLGHGITHEEEDEILGYGPNGYCE
jgi:antitoxin VapB